MEKKEKNVVAKVGNFVIAKESGNGLDWMSVKAVSGFWTVRYREDNSIYGMILMLARNKDYGAYLEAFVNTVYVLSNCTPDLEFLEEFHKAYHGMMERRRAVPATEEEDKAALDEVKAMYEMQEELRDNEKEGE